MQRLSCVAVNWLGVGTNVGLVAVKGGVGTACGSAALVADAAHSAGDLISDFVTIAAMKLGAAPPDEDHPLGHAKFETVGALAIGGLLIATGVGIGAHGVEVLATTAVALSRDAAAPAIESVAPLPCAAAAALAILSKEALYRVTLAVGEREDRPVVVANAHHHRSDALSSVVALCGIGGAACGAPLLDPVAAVVVAAMITRSGVQIGWEAVMGLTDAVDKELVQRIARAADELTRGRAAIAYADGGSSCGDGGAAALAGTPEIRSHSHLRVRMVRSRALVDLHIVVDPRITVSAAHTIADRVRHHLSLRVPEVADANVHVDVQPEVDSYGVRGLQRGVAGGAGAAAAATATPAAAAAGGAGTSVGASMAAGSAGSRAVAVAAELRDPSALSAAAEAAAISVDGVLDVTHTHTHLFGGTTAVETTIVVDETISVLEARVLGRRAREAVERVDGIDAADVHLELEIEWDETARRKCE